MGIPTWLGLRVARLNIVEKNELKPLFRMEVEHRFSGSTDCSLVIVLTEISWRV